MPEWRQVSRENYGRTVRAYREHQYMTRQTLAAHIGRSSEMVAKIEQGIKTPGLETQKKLKEILGLPLLEIVYSGDTSTHKIHLSETDREWLNKHFPWDNTTVQIRKAIDIARKASVETTEPFELCEDGLYRLVEDFR